MARFSFNEKYDLVIIGGGITGAGLARDAALRGLTTLLVDKGDFANGTSSRSGKLVHGGLRYLKYGHLKLVFSACQERYILLNKVAPFLVRPAHFFYPFYKFCKTPRWLAGLGIFLYSLLAGFRNIGLMHFLGRDKLFKMIPQLKRDQFVGGISYYDAKVNDSRLVIETIKSARRSGAHVCNYLEVLNITFEHDACVLELKDHLANANDLIKLKASTLINAAGIWADVVIARAEIEKPHLFNLKMTRGIHLTFSIDDFPLSEIVTVEDQFRFRNIYIVPWDRYVLVGTSDEKHFDGPDNPVPSQTEIDYLLDTLCFYFPTIPFSRKMIKSLFVGMRPLIGSEIGKREEEMSRDYEIIFNHARMLSISGGKLTTYRLMAKRCLDLLISKNFNGRKLLKCKT